MIRLFRQRVIATSARVNGHVLKYTSPSSAAPSETTTVMLKKLHPSATGEILNDVIAKSGISIRKAIIEPGCAVQLTNEVQAECVSTLLKHEFNCKVC